MGRKQSVYEIYKINGDNKEYLEKGQVQYICQKYGLCYPYVTSTCAKTGEGEMYHTYYLKKVKE